MEPTDAGISVSLEEFERIQGSKLAMPRFPAPFGDVSSVGFVVQKTVPSFENLLAAAVVPIESSVWIVDP